MERWKVERKDDVPDSQPRAWQAPGVWTPRWCCRLPKLVGTDVALRLPYGIQTLTDFSLPFQRERGRHFLQSQSLNPLQLIAHLMDDDTISSSLVFTTTLCPSRPGASQSQSER